MQEISGEDYSYPSSPGFHFKSSLLYRKKYMISESNKNIPKSSYYDKFTHDTSN
jgi:hypothetical protein